MLSNSVCKLHIKFMYDNVLGLKKKKKKQWRLQSNVVNYVLLSKAICELLSKRKRRFVVV